jgi:hypothetical protein
MRVSFLFKKYFIQPPHDIIIFRNEKLSKNVLERSKNFFKQEQKNTPVNPISDLSGAKNGKKKYLARISLLARLFINYSLYFG